MTAGPGSSAPARPLISVIIPVFNAERYVGAAIQSVLAQTYRPLEVIAIDDGSTDRGPDIVRAFAEVQYAVQPHRGLGAALNHALCLARGEFLAFLDADDLWPATKLTIQMAHFDHNPALDIAFGHVQPFFGDTPPSAGRAGTVLQGYSKGTMLITRSAFFRVGQFDPQWRVGDFVDWYVRAQELGLKSLMLPEVLLLRRVHANNMGVRERDQRRDYVHILKRALDRRKEA